MIITAGAKQWGTLETSETHQTVIFSIVGEKTNRVWRVWGISPEKEPLLIGIPEPGSTRMLLHRTVSKTYLKNCGYWPQLPERYAAGETIGQAFAPEETPRLPPELSDIKTISSERHGAFLRITCPFDKTTEFPLAFCFTSCRIRENTAELWLDIKTGLPAQGSPAE